ncbi:SWI/SNF family DNA-dependent ATPase [Trichophyton rubrum D6]|uniref:SWI/SNF family DNA-dependent ATPase Ris1 n=3 Tax=Trichophyton rubrum TaxID=5551 RepID=A0A178EU25_TRIRU|nr:SWI/SNF family DNA-dependent ATPase [Trichophyton rubrum MR850]EZF36902.1 SWI/SNF family DNA-dependent ATPase [Trichophyton rubrum CBS 100081]EZF47536.1 SWI/SNF family DNA-dependent ATPase [Trichophyton rubrum CBS 288.86]EZF58194.1 SWI/SNF family DNA-dependent ATPase [Trichophyton rubrum CBS 289.86]EZF79536.1 SWI/SNF family DNA-dependent ATPase [Trichophyton rubrum MR1448]EZG11601.1 SWI/SNF family DNA-dependent ATPase [Trichophyton rubrum CBS 202.88]KDB28692.1 SWI/SNF family DNA-dependent 
MDSGEIEKMLSWSDSEDKATFSYNNTPAGSRRALSPLPPTTKTTTQHRTPPQASSSSSSSSSHLPAPAMEAGPSRKRPRAPSSPNTSSALLHDSKTRRHASSQRNTGPSNQPASATAPDPDLLGFFGIDEDDEFIALEEEQRKAEAWLKERREQERRDEEFARTLQETWDETLHNSSRSDEQDEIVYRPPPPPAPTAMLQRQNPTPIQEYTQPHFTPRPQLGRHASTLSPMSEQARPMLPPLGPVSASRSSSGFPVPSRSSVFERKDASNSTSSWQKTGFGGRSFGSGFSQNNGSRTEEPWRATPNNYIELSSDSDVEDSSNSLPNRAPSAAVGNSPRAMYIAPTYKGNPYGNSSVAGSSERLPGVHRLGQMFGQGLRTFDFNRSLEELNYPPSMRPFMTNQCPPGCLCGREASHAYLSARSRIDSLREMYAVDGLTPDEMKKELKSLLENIRPDQELDLNREGTPEALKFPLMEHQKLGLAWMRSMEEGSNKGGILADDMGLGKTIQALALMVSRPSTDPARKTNLIIAPVALIQQWKREINRMLKPGSQNQLSIFILHGERRSIKFQDLRRYDVVLTTFGTLASELKRKEQWMKFKKDNPTAYQNLSITPLDDMPLLGEISKWYRIIIDEAQCIKNRGTKSAQACYELQSIYRWCMSGTPMMNNVQELYSLICFLRIGPYNKLERFNSTFTRPLKNDTNAVQSTAMKKLQALLKAILLRRTKSSKIDGKPILQLPPRVTEKVHTIFSSDEQEFYKALETQSQLQFNRYLQAGTVGRNYSNVLVLLLRLRQACCHPHLINDFAVNLVTNSGEIDLIANAKKLDNTVVERLKAQEALECPVCIDVAENAVIFFPCGHSTCAECFARISDPAQGLMQGNDGTIEVKCPSCRAKIDPKKVTDHASFQKVHVSGENTTAEDGKSVGQADDTADSDSDSDDDNRGTLNGFIVRDRDEERSKKGKGKAKPKKTLAELKKDAQRNVKAKRKYLRTLDKRWETSAKVDKTIEILQSLRDSGDEKTIIFSQFTSLLDLIEVPINRRGWNYRRYDGSMKPADRNDSVLDFTDNPDCRIMLVSLKAGNSGLNLVAASQVIILDPFWNPYIEDQAIDRAHRIGQLRPVMVHRLLIENTVEDRIIALQDKKRQIIEGALDEKASSNVGRLGVQELNFLFNGHQ